MNFKNCYKYIYMYNINEAGGVVGVIPYDSMSFYFIKYKIDMEYNPL